MIIERPGSFNFKGKDVTIIGPDLRVGDLAPEFVALNQDWSQVKALESTSGKTRIIGSLPSLSSSTCDLETRRFNEAAAALGEDIVVLMVSMDLPWTLKNWCGAAGVDRVMTLSDHTKGEFGKKYGVLLEEPRIFRRAIFVVNPAGQIVYSEYMPRLGDEPDYAAVLAAARQATTEGIQEI